MENSLSDSVRDYIHKRANDRLEKLDKDHAKTRQQGISAERELALQAERQQEIERYLPAVWLTDAARRAGQISFATHPLKFIHPDARGSSANVTQRAMGGQDVAIICSETLSNIRQDVVGNAAALDVAGLLQLESGGVNLAQKIAVGDVSDLAEFAHDDEQLADWQSGFSKALSGAEMRSHSRAKQVYFPVSNGYHLLSPLFSSALAQAIHIRITDSRYSEQAVAARKARREELPSDLICTDYPHLAVQSFGGTKPQNISQQNNARGGRVFLLPAMPPSWTQQFQLPKSSRYAFWNAYKRRVFEPLNELALFLRSVRNKDSNLAIRQTRASLVQHLIDELLQFAAQIQAERQHAGWTDDSLLSRPECLWLDLHHPDPDFQHEREQKIWCKAITEQFAIWLNKNLKDKQISVADVEFDEWHQELKAELEIMERDIAAITGLKRTQT